MIYIGQVCNNRSNLRKSRLVNRATPWFIYLKSMSANESAVCDWASCRVHVIATHIPKLVNNFSLFYRSWIESPN